MDELDIDIDIMQEDARKITDTKTLDSISKKFEIDFPFSGEYIDFDSLKADFQPKPLNMFGRTDFINFQIKPIEVLS